MELSLTVLVLLSLIKLEKYKSDLDFASFILLLSTLFKKYSPSPPFLSSNKDDWI